MRPFSVGAACSVCTWAALASADPVYSGSGAEPIVGALAAGEVGADTAAQGDLSEASSSGHNQQLQLEPRIGVGFALPILSTDFSDRHNAGYHFAGELGLGLGRWHLAAAVHHSRVFLGEEAASEVEGAEAMAPEGGSVRFDAEGGSFVLTEAFAMARFDVLRHPLRPYILAGGGVAVSNPTELTVSVTTQQDSGESQTDETRSDAGTSVDPLVTVGIGASNTIPPFDVFGQLRGSFIFLGDDVAPLAMVTVGAGF